MIEKFKDYLRQRGYSEYTPTHQPSTVHDYPRRINYVIWLEKYQSWNDVVINIDSLLSNYGKGGSKESLGKKSNSAVINALKRFYEYLNDNNLYKRSNN